MKLSRDVNGNKTLTYSHGNTRGFSVQTLGNLPRTHRMTNHDFNESVAMKELGDYIKQYGTARQKDLLGF